MANAFYGKGLEGLSDGSISWASDTIKCVLVDSAQYTPSLGTDANLSDIPVGARTAISGALTSKTNVLGVLDANDALFTSVTGVQSEYVVVYKDTGTPSTSRLILLVDTASGLPVTPNGNNITIVWDNGANKIGAI